MYKKITANVLVLLLACQLISICSAADDRYQREGLAKVSVAYLLDERDFNTASLFIASTRPLFGFSLFGFTHWHGDQGSPRSTDLTRSFSEYRLTYRDLGKRLNISGLSGQIEVNAFTPSGKDLARFGLVYKHSVFQQGWLKWRVFPYETDGDGGQFSLVYKMPLSRGMHISGFADYNIKEHSDNRWVIEPQLNIRLTDRITGVIKFRYNEFQKANPNLDGSGTAIGLRVKL